MPITYALLLQSRLVLTIWYGDVSLAQWKDHLSSLLADPDFDSTNLHLVDVRSATLEPAIKAGEIEGILNFLRPSQARLEGRRVAILSGREMPTSNLVASIVTNLGIVIATFVFSRTALEWLNLEPAEVEPQLQALHRDLPQER